MTDLKIGHKYLDRTSPLRPVEVTFWDYSQGKGALVVDTYGNAYRVPADKLEPCPEGTQ